MDMRSYWIPELPDIIDSDNFNHTWSWTLQMFVLQFYTWNSLCCCSPICMLDGAPSPVRVYDEKCMGTYVNVS